MKDRRPWSRGGGRVSCRGPVLALTVRRAFDVECPPKTCRDVVPTLAVVGGAGDF